MTNSILRPALAVLACTATLAFAAPSVAATVNMKAELKGASEVPPNASGGTGSVAVAYDTDSKKLSWKGSVTGLSGPATAAHFHGPAEPGKNAGVAIPISGADKGTFDGSATLTDAQAKELLDGKWYVNIHTATNKAGEIRGQLTK